MDEEYSNTSDMDRAVIKRAAEVMAGRWSKEIENGLYFRMLDLASASPSSGYAAHNHYSAALIALGDYCHLMAKIRLNRSRSLDNEPPKK